MISTVIVCNNEQDKINDLLKSVEDFTDEILIINIGVSDLDLIKKDNIKIIKHEFAPYVEKIRNYAISKASGDWILVLDPDERVTKNLTRELDSVIKEDKFVAVSIPRKNIFFGQWISRSNFWPDRHVRFFKKGKVKWTDFIHSYPRVDGRVKVLPAKAKLAIQHYGYGTHKEFIERQEHYSSVEASQRLKVGEHFSIFSLMWRPAREFLVRFVKYQAYLDGINGFFIVFFLMVYQVKMELKMLKGLK